MIYFSILFILLIFSISDLLRKDQSAILILDKYFYFVAMIILILFAGLRFDTGWDYKGYNYYYDLMPTIDNYFSNIEVFQSIYFEPGFKLLMMLSKSCGLDFYGFQFIVSLICLIIINKAIRKENSKLLFVFVYFSTCYLFLNMSVIRQGIAVAFLYMAVSSLFDNQKKSSVIYLLIGCLFHFSLIIMLPILLVSNKNKISNKIFYVVVGGALLVYIAQIHWLKSSFGIVSPLFPHEISYKINMYLDSERFGKSRDIGIGVIEKIVTFIVMLYIYKKTQSNNNLILLRFFIFYIFIYFAFYEITVLYDRLRFYFVALNVFVYLAIFNYFRSVDKLFVYFVICAYSLFSYINIFKSDSNRTVFIPYNSVLNSENSISPEYKGDLRIDRAIDMDR
ncbi:MULTISPECIES: EpsG family protein [unclassified Pseudocitrobacter]|uniref:EpsG family protein n=1 Tax=unclassified Pseudocitrobacter TaxID=2638778 RepID=UPI0023E412CA|nr:MULTISPECIES: EpsG family protein [unclassified Pseudocitrobacter]MDF3828190.1 EpsG family protein [Pseudocitrobacter sp. 2023EL-00150]MEC5374345.1 EpsG family protein [Pseudocitrobacter sp. MW920760]